MMQNAMLYIPCCIRLRNIFVSKCQCNRCTFLVNSKCTPTQIDKVVVKCISFVTSNVHQLKITGLQWC